MRLGKPLVVAQQNLCIKCFLFLALCIVRYMDKNMFFHILFLDTHMDSETLMLKLEKKLVMSPNSIKDMSKYHVLNTLRTHMHKLEI